MKTLCKLLGGSYLYKLNNENSDIDYRGVFMHTDPAFILGTKRFDEVRRQNDEEDCLIKELNHYATLLKKSNIEALELLFADQNLFLELTDEFKFLRYERYYFVDSVKLFKCLTGYMFREKSLTLGERTGRLGAKRHEHVKQYGFSPKNVVQLIRLANVGIEFYNEGIFITDCSKFRKEQYELLLSIKNTPEKFTRDEIIDLIESVSADLNKAYSLTDTHFEFDEDKINNALLEIYLPYLK